MSSYDQIQHTIYAITLARRYTDAEFHQAVRGWGGQETFHSDQWKIKGEELLKLQMHWQEKLDELNREFTKQWLDTVA